MRLFSFLALLAVFGAAACAPRDAALSTYRGLEFAIESHYETYAWERNATCLRPEISIARIETLEDTPEKLVVKVRYFWEDRTFGRDDEMFPKRGGGSWCSGFDERIFTLAKRPDGRVTVTAMTGPQREHS